MKCALCQDKKCSNDGQNCSSTRETAFQAYTGDKKKELEISSRLEVEHYMKLTRVEEVIQYALNMGYKKIGLAFCIGLSREAEVIHKIFEKHFEVFSVCCKNGAIDKSLFNLPKHREGDKESICNPIGQALELNKSQTDLNLIVGLCVGHDILFTRNSQAPVTTLVVKDRVLAHNPVGAIYSNYYIKRKFAINIKK